jgi:hypothetical protein
MSLTHAGLAATGLILMSFAAAMPAASPISRVLGLIRSFIHLRPVRFYWRKARWICVSGVRRKLATDIRS